MFATVSTIRLELSNTLRRIFDHRVSEAPDGYRITPYDPAFEKQMQSAERIMKKRRKVLRVLAK